MSFDLSHCLVCEVRHFQLFVFCPRLKICFWKGHKKPKEGEKSELGRIGRRWILHRVCSFTNRCTCGWCTILVARSLRRQHDWRRFVQMKQMSSWPSSKSSLPSPFSGFLYFEGCISFASAPILPMASSFLFCTVLFSQISIDWAFKLAAKSWKHLFSVTTVSNRSNFDVDPPRPPNVCLGRSEWSQLAVSPVIQFGTHQLRQLSIHVKQWFVEVWRFRFRRRSLFPWSCWQYGRTGRGSCWQRGRTGRGSCWQRGIAGAHGICTSWDDLIWKLLARIVSEGTTAILTT